jgi:hypothetical protein
MSHPSLMPVTRPSWNIIHAYPPKWLFILRSSRRYDGVNRQSLCCSPNCEVINHGVIASIVDSLKLGNRFAPLQRGHILWLPFQAKVADDDDGISLNFTLHNPGMQRIREDAACVTALTSCAAPRSPRRPRRLSMLSHLFRWPTNGPPGRAAARTPSSCRLVLQPRQDPNKCDEDRNLVSTRSLRSVDRHHQGTVQAAQTAHH